MAQRIHKDTKGSILKFSNIKLASMKSIQSQFDYITQLSLGYWQSQVLIVAVELGIFTLIYNKRRCSASEVSRSLKTNEGATESLLNSLVGMGLLSKIRKMYRNRPISDRFLVKDRPFYQGNRILLARNLWDFWSKLGRAIKTGKPVAFDDAKDEADTERQKVFINAMHEFAVIKVKAVAKRLNISGCKRLLDLGGGPGSYAIEFVRVNPGLHAVIFDLDDVIEITRGYIKDSGMEERVSTISGDCIKDDYGKDIYDIIFVSNLLHMYDSKINLDILRKCRMALKDKGMIVIHDFILDASGACPAFAALFSLNMLIGTIAGRSYRRIEIRDLLRKAGFKRLKNIDIGSDSSMILGFKWIVV